MQIDKYRQYIKYEYQSYLKNHNIATDLKLYLLKIKLTQARLKKGERPSENQEMASSQDVLTRDLIINELTRQNMDLLQQNRDYRLDKIQAFENSQNQFFKSQTRQNTTKHHGNLKARNGQGDIWPNTIENRGGLFAIDSEAIHEESSLTRPERNRFRTNANSNPEIRRRKTTVPESELTAFGTNIGAGNQNIR